MDKFQTYFKSLLPSINQDNFDQYAIELFEYQFNHNLVYHDFCTYLNRLPKMVKDITDIPFMPIEFFKNHKIVCSKNVDYTLFESSGTTDSSNKSKHYVSDVNFYLNTAELIFNEMYGSLKDFTILALLPNYLERSNSSLIAMVDYFIKKSENIDSGYYLYNHDDLAKKLSNRKGKVILIGVTFALLDFAENYNLDLSDVIIMETGGMKGQRKELLREEVHQILKSSFNVQMIHSEYGMTELLSQGYSQGNGVFDLPKWMKVLLREINDPLSINNKLRYGGINVIDFANVDSCAFIATQDLGRFLPNNQFEVIGRFDSSDVRGCNLMVI